METTKQLTSDYLDFAVNMKRTVQTTISQPEYDTDSKGKKTVKKEMGEDGKLHTVYEWREPVSFTLDYSNCVLSDIMKDADSSNVISVAGRNRSAGRDVCKAINGTIIDVRELHSNGATGITGALRSVDKINDTESIEIVIKAAQERLKALRKNAS